MDDMKERVIVTKQNLTVNSQQFIQNKFYSHYQNALTYCGIYIPELLNEPMHFYSENKIYFD